MTPSRIEYAIGETLYGQPLRLVKQRNTAGQTEWLLYRDEGNQSDDRVFIAGLTDEILSKMAEAARSKP